MSKIFYLMGKSASGKDTIYKKMVEQLPDFKTISISFLKFVLLLMQYILITNIILNSRYRNATTVRANPIINKDLLPELAKMYVFDKIKCVGIFSNGEAIYEKC